MVAPSSLAFSSKFLLTLQQGGAVGWPLPRWTSIAESFGIGTPYNTASIGTGARTQVDSVADGAASALTVAFLLALIGRCLRRPAAVLLISVLGAACTVYAKTRYLDHAINYQYFKAVVTLAPAGALATAALLGEAISSRRAHLRRTSGLLMARFTFLGSCVIAVAVTISALSFVVHYRQEGTVVPPGFVTLSGSSRAQTEFRQYNVVLPAAYQSIGEPRLLTMALGAEVVMNIVGPGSVLKSRIAEPAGLLVLEKYCPRYQCIANVKPRDVVIRMGGVALVRLSSSSNIILGLSVPNWTSWIANRSTVEGIGSIAG
jgi:hypothetical protein